MKYPYPLDSDATHESAKILADMFCTFHAIYEKLKHNPKANGFDMPKLKRQIKSANQLMVEDVDKTLAHIMDVMKVKHHLLQEMYDTWGMLVVKKQLAKLKGEGKVKGGKQ